MPALTQYCEGVLMNILTEFIKANKINNVNLRRKPDCISKEYATSSLCVIASRVVVFSTTFSYAAIERAKFYGTCCIIKQWKNI